MNREKTNIKDTSLLKANLKVKQSRKTQYIFKREKCIINSNNDINITINKNKSIALLLGKQIEIEEAIANINGNNPSDKRLTKLISMLKNITNRLDNIIDSYNNDKKLIPETIYEPVNKQDSNNIINSNIKFTANSNRTADRVFTKLTKRYYQQKYLIGKCFYNPIKVVNGKKIVGCTNLINLLQAINPDKNCLDVYKRLYDYKNYVLYRKNKKQFKPFYNFTKTQHFKHWIKSQNYKNGFYNNCEIYFKKYILPKMNPKSLGIQF